MVRKLSISPGESELSLPTGEEEREVNEADPLSSSYPTWSSRMKCLEAYVCVVRSFGATMEHCRIIGMYGIFFLMNVPWRVVNALVCTPFIGDFIVGAAYIAYLCCAITIGVPIVLVEILLGRYVMGNVSKAWSMCPIAKGVLACLFGTTAYIMYFHNICNTYLLKYLISFYHGYIPWDSCREPWAKDNCFVVGDNTTAFMKCIYKHSELYCKNLKWESSGTQYWKYKNGDSSSIYEVFLSAIYLALSITLVVLINVKGHRSCQKAFIVLVYLPIIISIILAFAAYITPGALPGIIILLNFNSDLFFDWRMWITVFEDFIVSAGLGTLAITFVSSHGRFQDNIFLDVLVVTFTTIFSSLLTSLPILSVSAIVSALHTSGAFCALNHYFNGKESNAVTFVRLSDAFLWFPYPNVFWSFLFYLEMILISLANQTIIMLAFCEALWGILLGKNKLLFISIIVGLVSFGFGVPYLFFATSILTVMLLFSITWQLCYGFRKFNDDYHFMLGYPPSFFFLRMFWLMMIPVLLGMLTVNMCCRNRDQPLKYMVFIYVAVPLFLYLFVALVQIILAAKRGNINSAFSANPNWGPENSVLKTSRIIFDTRTITKEFMYRQELYRKPLFKPPNFSHQNIVQLS